VATDLLRRYGRSPLGTRLHDHTPCGHWQTHTVIAGLRLGGLTATAVFDGPIDSVTFLAYIEQILVPSLRRGDVVVLDNLGRPQATGGPRRDRIRRGARAVSAAVQSGFQSHRTRLREAESLSACGAATELRPRL
jgi:hypothetical protein